MTQKKNLLSDPIHLIAAQAILLLYGQLARFIRLVGLWWLWLLALPYLALFVKNLGGGYAGCGFYIVMMFPVSAAIFTGLSRHFVGQEPLPSPPLGTGLTASARLMLGQMLFLGLSLFLILASLYGLSMILTPLGPWVYWGFLALALFGIAVGYARLLLVLPAAGRGQRIMPEEIITAARGLSLRVIFGLMLTQVPMGLLALLFAASDFPLFEIAIIAQFMVTLSLASAYLFLALIDQERQG